MDDKAKSEVMGENERVAGGKKIIKSWRVLSEESVYPNGHSGSLQRSTGDPSSVRERKEGRLEVPRRKGDSNREALARGDSPKTASKEQGKDGDLGWRKQQGPIKKERKRT